MTPLRPAIAIAVVFMAFSASLIAAPPEAPQKPERLALPQRPPLTLRYVAKLGPGPGRENSGIVRGRARDGLFWMHNDSGNEPRIYPIHRDGSDYKNGRGFATGVLLEGAANVDWEDIAVDRDGNLIVADVGNNANKRRDLALYYVAEPKPDAERAPVARKVRVRYPDQMTFPAPQSDFNFDCEAVFTVGNTVHLLTKHRSDSLTKLYRLDDPNPDDVNTLTLVDTFDIQGFTTAADATADGLRLAVITYHTIWLFERDTVEQPFFAGRIWWAPFVAVQMEAVCFADDKTLLLADEKLGQLYEAPLEGLTRVR